MEGCDYTTMSHNPIKTISIIMLTLALMALLMIALFATNTTVRVIAAGMGVTSCVVLCIIYKILKRSEKNYEAYEQSV